MKTLADDRDLTLALAAQKRATYRRNLPVRAPCCGRRRPADGIIDFRGTDFPLDWACGGCRKRHTRPSESDWTEARALETAGAPTKAVAHLHAVERYRALRAEARRADRPFLRADARREVLQ